ncbi:hypothetical protein MNBD_GAMMA06-1678 [hydrothermal vent metagenome]|uniref:Uncharacterized protein n=1 Tax=hydrothermal vent metagenome TaxID=652676 RepID=A0A3B0WMK6_9ZZZZ
MRALHGVDFSSWQGKDDRKNAAYTNVSEYFEVAFNAAMAEKMLRAKLSLIPKTAFNDL